ncbi:MAG: PAS domain S-box protein [Pelosinus sp.]|nr:PAS domain S-box protein [Pelosinus sp.]
MKTNRDSVLMDEFLEMRQEMQPLSGKTEFGLWKAFSVSPIPMLVFSYHEGLIFDVNDAFTAFTGYLPQELIGYTGLELGIWAKPNERKKIIHRVIKLQKVHNAEVSIRSKADKILIALFSCEQVILSNKPYLLAWFVDISDMKQEQEELWKQKQEIKVILENSPDVVARIDKEFCYRYISPAIENLIGISATKFIGHTLSELGFEHEICAQWRSNIGQVFKTGQKVIYERCLRGVQGREYYHQVHLAPVYAVDGSVEYVLSHIRNITSVKEAEKALIKSEKNKQRILDAFPDLLFLMNKSGEFLEYQAGNKTLLYASPEIFMGKKLAEVLPGKVAEKIMYHIECAIESEQMQVFDYQLMVQGKAMTFEARVVCANNADEVLFIVRDITKLKELEGSLARFDRLNTVGEMAAGIAHELRNPMTTVRGFLQILGNKPETRRFTEQFTLMIDELDRANSIITEYLSLAKNKVVQSEYHNLSPIIESLAPLIRADATISGKRLDLMLAETADLIVNPKEIRQMLLNLARNGLEAMQSGTTLTIKTYQENDEVVLVVQDQGSGIKKDVLENIGTPFFTTKDNGNGLGLSICYTIAAHHNAAISIDTSPAGTSFFVRFKIDK